MSDSDVLRRQSFGTAAPPDDGGHQGSFTTPDQDLDVSPAAGRRHSPNLAIDSTRPPVAGGGAFSVIFLVLFMAVALPVLFSYCRAAG